VLAISIYHHFDHLWKIPLLIRNLSDQYRMELYSMAKGGWDLMCVARMNEI